MHRICGTGNFNFYFAPTVLSRIDDISKSVYLIRVKFLTSFNNLPCTVTQKRKSEVSMPILLLQTQSGPRLDQESVELLSVTSYHELLHGHGQYQNKACV
jgi:hypothetical protein